MPFLAGSRMALEVPNPGARSATCGAQTKNAPAERRMPLRAARGIVMRDGDAES